MNRRNLLTLAGAIGAGAIAYPTLIEPEWVQLTSKRVLLSRLAAGTSIRLLHLADMHASAWVPMFLIERAIDMTIAAQPDLICLTGDFITVNSGYDRNRYIRALRRLAGAAPVYAVLGNHDGGEWQRSLCKFGDTTPVRSMLLEAGIRLLHNESELLRVAGARLRLVGVGDLWAQHLDARAAFRAVDDSDPVVLLSHNPDSKDVMKEEPWNLMLSGHTHGGQVVPPWWGPRFAPVMDKRYVAGLNPWGDRQIHTTRGVGSIGSLRFNCRPEVSILELTGTALSIPQAG